MSTVHRATARCAVTGSPSPGWAAGRVARSWLGVFQSCEFCALSPGETDMLRVFLGSRGNLREVERHLGVSYPTARLRFAALLNKLGLGEETAPEPVLTRDQILAEVASGAVTPAEAQELLAGLS